MHNRIKIVLVRSIDKLRHRCKCSGELRMPSYPRLLGATYGVLKDPAPDAEASSGVVDCGLWPSARRRRRRGAWFSGCRQVTGCVAGRLRTVG